LDRTRFLSFARCDIGDEALVARLIFAGDHDRLADSGMFVEHSLDFAEFDAVAAEFHLMIHAPDELD